MCMDGLGPPKIGIRPIGSDGFAIIPLGSSPLGGDMHETFQVDKTGNISNGHTTIRIPGGQDIHLPWPD